MAESILNVFIEAKSNPTVRITVNDAGVVSGTGSVSPIVKYVSTGDIGPSGAVGPTGSVSEGDTVFRANMAPNSIGSTEIIDGSVTHSELQNNSVYGNKILNGGVSGIKLADGSVAGNKLAANSIDATKIADGAITAELLELGLITASQIRSKSITASEIANNTLVGALFVDNSVDGSAIEDDVTLIGTVTVNHLELEGSSPALIEGPSSDDINIKTHDELNIKNTSGSTVASFDQSGNLTLSGNVDGINIATDVAANTSKTGITSAQSSAITSNTSKATNTVTNLGSVAASSSFTVTSSDGQNASLSAANSSVWGVMTNNHVNSIAANTSKTGITTSQTSAITANTSKVSFPGFGTISTKALAGDTALLQLGTSSSTALAGNTALLALGTSSSTALAGDTSLLSLGTTNSTALAGDTTTISSTQASAIISNVSKATNVSTNLSVASSTGAVVIASSDGTDATIPIATTSVSGVMSKAIFDEHELNNAKNTNVVQTTISGNAATATALTSGNKSIAGNLSITGTNKTFVMNSVQVATITSSRVVIGQTNRILQLDSSQCRVTSINLGHATDTTLARVSAGVVSIEGVNIQKENAHHHFIHAGFFMSFPYARYIPLNGSLNEQNTATLSPEYVNFTFPYDGFVKKMILRSETNMGNTNLKLYKGATGATVSTALGNVTAAVGASAAVEFDFTSVSSAYSKGDTMAILVDPTEDPDGGQNITIELVFDLTT